MARSPRSTPRPSVDRTHAPDTAVLSDRALLAWQEVQSALGVPVVPNDSEGAYSNWYKFEETGKKVGASLVKNALSAKAPGVVVLIGEDGEIISPLDMSKGLAWFNEPLKAGVLDVRAQARWEVVQADRNAEKRRYAWSTREPILRPWKELVLSVDEPRIWARLMTGDNVQTTSATGRDLIRKWAPVLSKQYPVEAPQIMRAALQLVFEANKIPLPKASSPSPLTTQQNSLRVLVDTCVSLAGAMEKMQRLAGHPVSLDALLPDAVLLARTAFEQKDLREKERQKTLSQTPAGEANVPDPTPPQTRPKTEWEQGVEEGRRTMMAQSISSLDVQTLEWLTNQCEDRGQWMGTLKSSTQLVTTLADSVSRLQRLTSSAQVKQQASDAGAKIVDFLADKGLNIVLGCSTSALRTDNPFYWLAHLCHGDISGGAFAQRLIGLATRQMREVGLELPDAEAYFADAQEKASAYAGPNTIFKHMAEAHLQRWHLDAELERAAQERVGDVSTLADLNESPASALPVRRRSSRL